MTTKEHVKLTGSTFTPKGLADYLADRILAYCRKDGVKVLDPACGDGELLASISKRLTSDGIDFRLTGFDANADYLDLVVKRSELGNVELINGDFLDAVDLSKDNSNLELFTSKKSEVNNSFDIVIANPPYVRTQILGANQAQKLAQKFNLKGRVDLYYPFLIAMTASLKIDGILGVITSNRYLSTKSGDSIRKFLSEQFEILEIIDLGDTKLFSAAVLPAIFIGKKKKEKAARPAKFIKVYEELNGNSAPSFDVENIYSILRQEGSGYFSISGKIFKKTEGNITNSTLSNQPWELLSDDESRWVSIIDQNAKNRIGDLFKVKVGIKTTADKVFIRDDWDHLGDMKPEEELLKQLISQENIEAWGAEHNKHLRVLYPYHCKQGSRITVDLERYPKTKQYFLSKEGRLKSRKYLIDSGRAWFEIWVPHRPDYWNLPKLIFPDISVSPRFYFDNGGMVVNGNCYWIPATKEDEIDSLMLIQGIANSNLMTKYHDLVFNNKLYSGRRRYFTQYVERYPIPDQKSKVSKEIVQLVRTLNASKDQPTRTNILKEELEVKVATAFGVDPVFTLD